MNSNSKKVISKLCKRNNDLYCCLFDGRKKLFNQIEFLVIFGRVEIEAINGDKFFICLRGNFRSIFETPLIIDDHIKKH